MGFYRAWLFGEQAIDHGCDDRAGRVPRAEAWLPLDVVGTLDDGPSSGGRRGCSARRRMGRWIEFGLPTPLITEYLGPRADLGLRNGPRESVALKRAEARGARGWSKCRASSKP